MQTSLCPPPTDAAYEVVSQAYPGETRQETIWRTTIETGKSKPQLSKRWRKTFNTHHLRGWPSLQGCLSMQEACTYTYIPYRGSLGACTTCKTPGHGYGICPHPKPGLCPRCGRHKRIIRLKCTSSPMLCSGLLFASHLALRCPVHVRWRNASEGPQKRPRGNIGMSCGTGTQNSNIGPERGTTV